MGARQVFVVLVLCVRESAYLVMQVNTGCCSAMRGECVAAVNACRLLIGGPGVSEVEGCCCAVLCCVVGWSRGRLDVGQVG